MFKLAQEIKHINAIFTAFLLILSLITGSMAAAQSDPAETPPQMSELIPKTEENRQLVTWDNPSAFGSVPPNLQAIGDFICAKGRIDLYAVGFHPKAKDKDGNEIPGGGYLCDRKSTGDQPHEEPPRLALQGNLMGWDRPSAFGLIPQSLLNQARLQCLNSGPKLDAIGYHPRALDEKGRRIPGGGYLCGPALQP